MRCLCCSQADDGDDEGKLKVIGGVLAAVAVIVLGGIAIKKVCDHPFPHHRRMSAPGYIVEDYSMADSMAYF